jgi:hypothetical protein
MVTYEPFPSSPRRGGCAIKNKLRSILSRADGVVINHKQILLEFTHHPVRSTKDASRYFIDIADAPPRRGTTVQDKFKLEPEIHDWYAFGTMLITVGAVLR